MKLKPVIFTDLDGTLLDLETYSYDEALPSIEHLRSQEVAIVFCSDKTGTLILNQMIVRRLFLRKNLSTKHLIHGASLSMKRTTG